MVVALIIGVVLAAVIAIEGWLLLHLLQQNGRFLSRIEQLEEIFGGAELPAAPVVGLPVGAPAPSFRLTGLYGETMTLDAFRAAGKPIMLLFSDPSCGPCDDLLPDVARWQREHGATLTIPIVSSGTPDENRPKVSQHGLATLLLQEDQEVLDAYQAPGTPSAVLVRADGTIGSPVAVGASAIRALVERAVGGQDIGAPLPVNREPASAPGGQAENLAAALRRRGRPAPNITLPDLDGILVSVAPLAGKPTVALFWDPQCGFCQRMLNDLKAWERKHPSDAPELLVISTGDAGQNRALGLRSTLLLDSNHDSMRALGGDGTPTAVLLDPRGNIVSGTAVGAGEVLDLLNGRKVPPLPAANQPTPTLTPTPTARDAVPTVYAAQPIQGGPAAPPVSLPDLRGNTVELSSLRGQPTMLLFWNPNCGFCRKMLDDVKAWEANPPAGAPRLLVVSTGAAEANLAQGIRSTVVLDQGFQTGTAFGARGTPSAVLVDAAGNIASGLAVGAPGVLDMAYGRALPSLQASPATAANGAAQPLAPMMPQIGQKAPEFALPDLDGQTIDLKDLRGEATLLLFWGPGCGVCRRMLPDLLAWEANPPPGAPRLVAISSGTVEANREMGLRSPVLLDTGFSTGRKYGARGTPSAVLIDAKGHVASKVAVGIRDSLALAGVTATTL
jgi:peroxiredoxin